MAAELTAVLIILSLSTDILALVLIAVRLLQQNRRQKLCGASTQKVYTSLLLGFIEASFLSTAVKIASVITTYSLNMNSFTGSMKVYITENLLVTSVVNALLYSVQTHF